MENSAKLALVAPSKAIFSVHKFWHYLYLIFDKKNAEKNAEKCGNGSGNGSRRVDKLDTPANLLIHV